MTQLSLINEPLLPPLEMTDSLATIVVPPLEGEYLYSFNSSKCPDLSVGCIIEVQLGRRVAPGFVISTNSERERTASAEMQKRGIKIKSVPSSARPIKAFTEEHLTFFEWIAKYYAEPLSKILDVAVPTPAFGKRDPFIKLVSPSPEVRKGAAQQRVINFLSLNDVWTQASSIRQACDVSSAILKGLEDKGLVVSSSEPPLEVRPTPTLVF
jgi:primosomal protein N'